MKKTLKLPMVLSISLLLILSQIAGAFYARSLPLFAYAGVILALSFSALPLIANQNLNISQAGFKKSQFQSILLNSAVLAVLALIIIKRAFAALNLPQGTNLALTCWIAFAGFIGLLVCAAVLIGEKELSEPKLLSIFYKYLIAAFGAFFVIIGAALSYLKGLYFIDSYVSIFFALIMILQAAVLIKKSLKSLKCGE